MIRPLARWFRRRRLERDLDDELGFHVEAHTRDLIAEGVSPQEARRRALAEFGGLTPIKERTREVHRSRWMDDLRADLTYTARAMRHRPGFAAVTVLTLTLGIGANTAIFSMVNAVLLRPLPVRQPNELVLFSDSIGQGSRSSTPFPDGQWELFSTEIYRVLGSQPSPFASIAAFEASDYTGSLELPGRPDGRNRVDVDFVSGNYFETLGASPALGRALTEADDRSEAPPVAVASDRFWRDHLDADPHVVGRTMTVDHVAYTVIGVMPPPFFGVRVQQAPDIWTPISRRDAAVRDRTNLYWLSLVGRLRRGQTLITAESAMGATVRQFVASTLVTPISEANTQRLNTIRIRLSSGARGISMTRTQNSRLLTLLFAAVGVILVIACANVGTLFLARATSREREVAVRRALGASRSRLIRQWLTESALLGLAGAICGGALARFVAPRLLTTFVPHTVPVAATIDGVVLGFTTAITVLACLLFGLAPALNAGRVDPIASLRLSGRAQQRRKSFGLTEPFVIAQIAMSLVLVVAATLLVRTLTNLEHEPYGFDQENVLLAEINPRPAGYRPADAAALYRRIYERVITLPGVESATFARFAPFNGHVSTFESTVDGYEPRPGETVRLFTVQVGPNYPQTLGMPVALGRALGFDDVLGAPPVAMVNEAFAARFFPSRSPLGRHFKNRETYEIVGVVKDAQFRTARDPMEPMVFIPMLQEKSAMVLDCEIQLRTRGNAGALTGALRQAIAAVDPRVTIRRTRTMRELVLSTFVQDRTAVGFILSFAAIALLVASLGLYGVVSHGLARRTNELGVRIALGAERLDVVWLVARETLGRLAIGLLIGFLLAQGMRGVLASQLFGVTPADPVSLAVAALVLSVVVALAIVRPLVRAMRVDPVGALRAE